MQGREMYFESHNWHIPLLFSRLCLCRISTVLRWGTEKTSDLIFLFWEPGREISKYSILFLLLGAKAISTLKSRFSPKKYAKGLQLNFLTREVCTVFHLWSYRICISQKKKKMSKPQTCAHTEKIGLLLSTEWIDAFIDCWVPIWI